MLIEAHGLSVRAGQKQILEPVDFSIDAGEIVTVVGPNGAGKTTFLRALIGALPLTSGHITRAPGLRIGYVPQRLQLDASLPIRVRRFLDLPVRAQPAMRDEIAVFTQCDHLLDGQMGQLSGGELQRVLLAHALMQRPQLLILDEATRGLDHLAADSFYRRIEQVRQTMGCAVLMVSHELHVVMAASDRVLCLNGHICCQGTPEQVIATDEYRALFGGHSAGMMALYRHDHDHSHDGAHARQHGHHNHHHEQGGTAAHGQARPAGTADNDITQPGP